MRTWPGGHFFTFHRFSSARYSPWSAYPSYPGYGQLYYRDAQFPFLVFILSHYCGGSISHKFWIIWVLHYTSKHISEAWYPKTWIKMDVQALLETKKHICYQVWQLQLPQSCFCNNSTSGSWGFPKQVSYDYRQVLFMFVPFFTLIRNQWQPDQTELKLQSCSLEWMADRQWQGLAVRQPAFLQMQAKRRSLGDPCQPHSMWSVVNSGSHS